MNKIYVSLICVLISVADLYAQNPDNGDKALKDKLNEQKENYDAHRSYVKVHFPFFSSILSNHLLTCLVFIIYWKSFFVKYCFIMFNYVVFTHLSIYNPYKSSLG